MNIKKVWAVYFSATGTTKKVVTSIAKTVAESMGIKYEDRPFTLPENRESDMEFMEEDLVIFGVPVYAGRVPNVLLPFLTKKIKAKNAPAVPIVLFGNRNYDDALIELRNILNDDGFKSVAAGAFVGEHSFSKVLGQGRPDESDMIVATDFAKKIVKKINDMTEELSDDVAVTGDEPIRPYYKPQDRDGNFINILKVKPKTDMSICIDCKVCAEQCPMGSINADNVDEIPGLCIKCCSCIKKCPVDAKYFDDEGFLYHKHELEDIYERRAEVALFL